MLNAKRQLFLISIVSHTDAENPASSFSAREINSMLVEQLHMHGIQEKANTTHFTEKLVKSLPELHIKTIDNKIRLVFKRNVKKLLGEHVKCPDDFLVSVRSILPPVRKKMADQCNEFDGSFNNSSKFTSVPNHYCTLSIL